MRLFASLSLALLAVASLTTSAQTPAAPRASKAPAQTIAPTPPMGWNSWNFFAEKVTDKDIRGARLDWATPFALICGGHRAVALENLALRQQLAVFKRTIQRPPLRPRDRLFWVALAHAWRTADRVGSELFRVVQIPDGTTTPTH